MPAASKPKIEFHCPKCEGRYFGSRRLEDGTWMRHCHGRACTFSWHQSEDWRYFVMLTTFKSAEELQAARDAGIW